MDDQNQTTTSPAAAASAPAKAQSSLAVPAAIVIGFGMIAAAIYFSGMPGSNNGPVGLTGETDTAPEPQEQATGPIRDVDENDHIRGNPNAPIMIVEYSDYDCPFCKNFHETMNLVMDNYGTTGQVAWVYRHFPLEQLHPSAPYIAAYAECVAQQAGNDAFWEFSDLVFGERNTNEPTNLARLSEFATSAGANDITALEACAGSAEAETLVEEDYTDALNAGARGTPHSIVMVGGQQGVINGAQPYDVVSQIIENLLAQVEE